MALHQTAFVVLLASIPVQLGLHYWPEWTYVLGRRIDFLSPTVHLTDILLVFLVIFYGIDQFKSRNAFIVSRQMVLYVVLFVIFASVNIYFAVVPQRSAYMWAKAVELTIVFWYIRRTKPKQNLIMLPLLIGVLYESVIAIGQFILQHSIGGALWFFGERSFAVSTPGIARVSFCLPSIASGCHEWLRAYGTFPHPNVLGGFLALTLVYLLYTREASNEKQIRAWLFFSIYVGGVVALYVTFSRSAWSVYGIGTAIVLLYRYGVKLQRCSKRTMRYLISVGAVAFVFFCMAIALRPGMHDETVVQRMHLHASAVSMWRSSPVFGVGLGNFLNALPDHTTIRTIQFLQPVHSIYMLALAEAGIIGGIVFAVCIVFVFTKCMSTKNFMTPLPFFLLLLLGMIDHYPFTLHQGQLLFVLFLAISYVYR